MKPAAGEARKSATFATSSGVPARPSGIRVRIHSATAARASGRIPAAAPSVAESAAAALGLGTRLVDGEIAPAHRVVVQLVDRLLGFVVRAHLDEREPARAARGHVAHHVHRFDRARALEQLLKIRFANRGGEVA